MRWLRVMAVSLALLAAANIFVGIRLRKLYSETHVIGDNVIKDTVTLLEKSGIEISPEVIPKERSDYSIYEFDFFPDRETYYRSAASVMMSYTGPRSESEDLTLYLIADGIRITSEGRDTVIDFSEEGISSFVFSSDGRSDEEAEYCGAVGKWGTAVSCDDRAVKSCLREFRRLTGFSSEGSAIETVCTGAFRNSDGSRVFAELCQTVDGIPISGMSGSCLMRDGTIVYVTGSFLFNSDFGSYSTVLYDQINALFDERDALRGSEVEISSMEAVYTVSHISGEDKLYLVPAWKMTYTDISTNEIVADIRDMLDGSPVAE